MEEFFEWCKDQRAWHGEASTLDRAKGLLIVNGDDLESMGAATIKEWRAAGLLGGYRKRLKKAAKLWLLAS